jgi:hypothetical protein
MTLTKSSKQAQVPLIYGTVTMYKRDGGRAKNRSAFQARENEMKSLQGERSLLKYLARWWRLAVGGRALPCTKTPHFMLSSRIIAKNSKLHSTDEGLTEHAIGFLIQAVVHYNVSKLLFCTSLEGS